VKEIHIFFRLFRHDAPLAKTVWILSQIKMLFTEPESS
jgi:hypothetical protein